MRRQKKQREENIWKIIVINIYAAARNVGAEEETAAGAGKQDQDENARSSAGRLQLNLKKNDNGSTNKLQPTCCMLHAAAAATATATTAASTGPHLKRVRRESVQAGKTAARRGMLQLECE